MALQTGTAGHEMMQNQARIELLGEHGWLVHWPDEEKASHWGEIVREKAWHGVFEIVPAYRTVAVICDRQIDDRAYQQLHKQIVESTQNLTLSSDALSTEHRNIVEVPVIYDGPDLHEVAEAVGMTVQELIVEHSRPLYHVYAVGFLPGFPYAGYLPERLSGLPRRKSPRPRVLAGSVAIAGRQTGIYPCESPGGWHLLGRTEMTICDLEKGFFLFRPGDWIQFRPVTV